MTASRYTQNVSFPSLAHSKNSPFLIYQDLLKSTDDVDKVYDYLKKLPENFCHNETVDALTLLNTIKAIRNSCKQLHFNFKWVNFWEK